MTASPTDNESLRNGVDTATLFATLDAVKQAPEAARFQFRARNEWVSGTHSREHDRRLLRRRRGAHPRAHLHLRRRPPGRAGRAATTARPRSSTCCTRWPPA